MVDVAVDLDVPEAPEEGDAEPRIEVSLRGLHHGGARVNGALPREEIRPHGEEV